MPPTGYLSSTGIEACLQYLASTYPDICQLIVLPETSYEGRTIRAIKIGKGEGPNRNGVLFLGGVHARELVNPDLLVSLALKLCQAYTTNTGLTFGPEEFSEVDIKLIVEALDVFILPQVNPDGRTYVLSPMGDAMWRKNRRPSQGSQCIGVDINRNYDLLWSSGIGTSSDPCDYQIYKGSAPFSESETRNVRWLLDTFPNIVGMIDVHSYSNDLLYPWGDDDDQTTDPSMNFMNTLYDGLRGSSGDNVYREYIPQADLNWYVSTGNRVIDAINAVRSAGYVLKQSIGLYPTSGTSDDYSYSRHYVDSKKKRIYSYTLETGKYTGNPYNDFQPPYSEALNIMTEASAGLIEFCLACLCVVTEVTQGTALMEELEAMRVFREEMLATSAGRRYVRLLEENTPEVLENVMRDSTIRDHALRVLQSVYQVVRTRTDSKPKVFDANVIEMVKSLVEEFYHCGSPRLQKALKVVQQDIRHFENKSAIEGLRLASEAEPVG